MNNKKANTSMVTKSQLRQILKQHDLTSRELRYQTTTASGTTAAAGTVWALTQPIVQGDNIENREGAQINVKKFTFTLSVEMNSAAGAAHIRVLLFRDSMCKGTNPGVTDILDSASVVTGYNVYWKQSNRYKVLVDDGISMSINGNSRQIVRHWTFDQNLIKVTYLGATDAESANGPNAYYFIILDNLAANHCTYAFGYSFEYFDS